MANCEFDVLKSLIEEAVIEPKQHLKRIALYRRTKRIGSMTG
jgi:hypothetical protein